MTDRVQVVADHHECLAHAPVAHRVQCKVLRDRMEMMRKMGKAKKEMKRASEIASAPSCAGKSLLEIMWEELMVTMERLMTPGAESDDGRDPGRAEGIAYCIAVVTNPYHVNIDAVREEAVERWEAENPAEEDSTD